MNLSSQYSNYNRRCTTRVDKSDPSYKNSSSPSSSQTTSFSTPARAFAASGSPDRALAVAGRCLVASEGRRTCVDGRALFGRITCGALALAGRGKALDGRGDFLSSAGLSSCQTVGFKRSNFSTMYSRLRQCSLMVRCNFSTFFFLLSRC